MAPKITFGFTASNIHEYGVFLFVDNTRIHFRTMKTYEQAVNLITALEELYTEKPEDFEKWKKTNQKNDE